MGRREQARERVSVIVKEIEQVRNKVNENELENGKWKRRRKRGVAWLLVLGMAAGGIGGNGRIVKTVWADTAASTTSRTSAVKTASAAKMDWGKYGFELKEKKTQAKGAEWYYLLRHKSGAQVMYRENDSRDMVFSIGFKTPPKDSKGANHVLEHALLCGSVKYPSRNIFTYLQGNSTASLMNAFTASDYTMYPFITANQKDFENLADCYLDMMFEPMLLKEPNIFRQQGIRVEEEDGKFQYNGIVFNEIKGKMNGNGDVAEWVNQNLYQALFDGTSMNLDSGGTVKDLKRLTYEDVVSVYQNYYRPDNAMVYLSGNQDLVKTLKLLDRYFTKFAKKGTEVKYDAAVPSVDKTVEMVIPGEKDPNRFVVGILHAGPLSSEQKETIAVDVINRILAKNLSKKYPELLQLVADGSRKSSGFILTSLVEKEKDAFLADYKNEIAKLVDGNIGKGVCEKILNGYQNGMENEWELVKVQDAMDQFVYADNPLQAMNQAAIFRELCQSSSTSYLQSIAKKYWLDEPRKVTLVGRGQAGQTETKEDDSLILTGDTAKKAKEESDGFKVWINKAESKEVLAKNPVLNLSDFREMNQTITADQRKKNGVLYLDTIQNGKEKVSSSYYFDFGVVDTKEALEGKFLQDLIQQYLSESGISQSIYSSYLQTYPDESDPQKYRVYLSLNYYGENKGYHKAMDCLRAVSQGDAIFDKKKWGSRLEKIRDQVRYDAIDNGSIYDYEISSLSAASRYQSLACGPVGNGNLAYYNWLNQLPKTRPANLYQQLKSIQKRVFTSSRLLIASGGSQTQLATLQKANEKLVKQLAKTKYPLIKGKLPKGHTGTAIVDAERKQMTATAAVTGNLITKQTPYSGKVWVLCQVIENAYLFPKARDLGAYGGSAMYLGDGGMLLFVSRTPDVKKSYEIIQGIPAFLESDSLTQKELDSYIIKTISDFDSQYLRADVTAAELYLNATTMKELQIRREEILNTKLSDLKAYIPVLKSIIKEENYYFQGNQTMFDQAGISYPNVIDWNQVKES